MITNRLILRSWEDSDKKDLIENINDLEVTKWLLVVPHPYTEKDANWWINHSKEKARKEPIEDYGFAIQLKEGPLIGGIGIHHVNLKERKAEVGYWLGRNFHGKGYGSEALEAILKFSFEELKLEKLEAGVFEGNPSSGKLLEKFGFEYRGIRAEVVCKADGKTKKEMFYELFRHKYLGGLR